MYIERVNRAGCRRVLVSSKVKNYRQMLRNIFYKGGYGYLETAGQKLYCQKFGKMFRFFKQRKEG